MSDYLTFMMGQFEATFPTDRRYAKNHMWAQFMGDGASALDEPAAQQATCAMWRFGFTAYAVRLLQDVYFLDWEIDAETDLAEGESIGAIESSKAESSLYAPIAGLLSVFNTDLLNDPSAINVDKYERGWLFEISGAGDNLMAPEEYIDHLGAVWEVTQKTIKGQLNQ